MTTDPTTSRFPLNGTHYTSEDDIEMMRSPEDWPRWPYLYVKASGWRTGVLVETKEHPKATDSVENVPAIVFDIRTGKLGEIIAQFDSLAALVAAGWKVD